MDSRARALLAALDVGPHRIEDLADENCPHEDLVARARELRRSTPALHHGRERELAAPDGVRAWRRTLFGEGHDVWDVVVAVNTLDVTIDTGLVGTRLLSSVDAPSRFEGVLLPGEAVVVRDETS